MELSFIKKLQFSNQSYSMKKTYIYVLFSLLFMVSSFYIPPRTLFSGEFRANKIMNYNDSALSSVMYQGIALIYDKPYENFAPANGISNGIIKLNNQPLYFEPTIKMYLDSADRKTNRGINWSLSETNNLTNFTYSCTSTYPVFNGVKYIPNEISKSDNLMINFVDLQDADQIEFSIDDLKLHLIAPWYRKINASILSLVIPKNHLQDLTCGTVTLRLSFIKNEEKNLFGKMFKFENRLNINKVVNLIN